MPDRDRRVHPRMPCHRRGEEHPARRVIDVLARLVSERGAPRYMRSDDGPEFVSNAILT